MTVFIPNSSSGLALIIGASGGIGRALKQALIEEASFDKVIGLSRNDSAHPIDITDEISVAAAAAKVSETQIPARLLIIASGFLHNEIIKPEKTYRHLDPGVMMHNFQINAIGPALVLKHFLPLMPRQGHSLYVAISARVGSISDNNLGGWHSYRASKAALNQVMRTLSIETQRINPQSIGVVLHPGTVDTNLSKPFQGTKSVNNPHETAQKLIGVMKSLSPKDNGSFFDHKGLRIEY
jgi:NAD(P)-dependent dehydrogenase (short-subunit alcohol dehydrogenase family)